MKEKRQTNFTDIQPAHENERVEERRLMVLLGVCLNWNEIKRKLNKYIILSPEREVMQSAIDGGITDLLFVVFSSIEDKL